MHKNQFPLASSLGMTLFLLGVPLIFGLFLLTVPRRRRRPG